MECPHTTTYPVVIEDTTDHYCEQCGIIVRTVTPPRNAEGEEDREVTHASYCALTPEHTYHHCPDIGFDAEGVYFR